MDNENVGTVFLVGAGPGDPGLITVAGRDALANADVVFYDRLAHPSLLDYCRSDAEKIFVGKKSATHFVRQEDTNDLMAQAALEGKTIVRLKGGDPFVFGRGGEEAEYLRARGVPFRIVPGISSAIAAPAYAGIPVTHRDASSSFAVITGHERDDAKESGTRDAGAAEQRRRWDRIAWAADTLIFLMAVESLPEISARLIENGRAPETPVALVQWGTWARQKVVTGTLADIVEVARAAGITAPAVTVIGDVVNYREALRWFDVGPLFGKRVLVTRAREQASALSEKLCSLGAEPVEFPTIQIAPPDDEYAALDTALASPLPLTPSPSEGRGGTREDIASVPPLPSEGEGVRGRGLAYDWIVFTSANGVRHAFDRLYRQKRDARALGFANVAAIGPATADALRERGIVANFVPTEFVAEAVIAQFPDKNLAGKRILLARAQEARDVLPEGWRAAGATVEVVSAYKTEMANDGAAEIQAQLERGEIDIVTFASSSTVRNFVAAVGGASSVPSSVTLACIGPITAQTCRELLREPDVVAQDYTIDGLIDVLMTSH